jgi:hypothetical protein
MSCRSLSCSLLLGLWLVTLLGTAGCGADGRYVMLGTAKAPSASGIVEVDDIGGGSSQVAVHLEFLHPPDKLDPSLTRYVVWFVPTVGSAVRAGTLVYDPVARTGDLTQTSPFHVFTVKVTAERDERPARPGSVVIATQDVRLD